MADGVCIDVAVAQATQTLQQLQQQQAALYSGMGAKYMPLDCKVRKSGMKLPPIKVWPRLHLQGLLLL